MKMIRRSTFVSTFLLALALGTVACGAEDSSSGKSSDGLSANLDWTDIQENNPAGKTADITILNDDIRAAGPEYEASVLLMNYGANTGSQHCRAASAGSCQIVACDFAPPAPGGDLPQPSRDDVGTIEVTGGAITPSLALPTDWYNNGALRQGLAWSGGEPIRFSASGRTGSFPAFDRTLVAPSLVTVTKPALPVHDPLTLDPSKDIELTWTYAGAAAGKVTASLTLSGRQALSRITCNYPVADQRGSVPASLLAQLPIGQTNEYAGFSVQQSEDEELDISDWHVSLRLLTHAMRPEGGWAAASLKFE